MRFIPFAVLLALIAHLLPELGMKRSRAVVQTVTASVTVWLRETRDRIPRTKPPNGFPRLLGAFLLLWIACLLLRIYIGPTLSSEMPEETSRERELLELRILHER